MIKAFSQGFMNVCRRPKYTPKYVKNGKEISARLVVPCISNNVGRKQEDGTYADAKPTYLDITMWGKSADTYAKLLGLGKGFYCEFRVDDYRRGVFDENRKREFKSDGSPKQIQTWGFTLIPGTVILGRDGAKLIAEEKTSGERPIGFDGKITVEELEAAVNSNTDMKAFLETTKQAKAVWANRCKEWNKREYTGGSTFGYADVDIPAGEGIQCAYSLNAAPAASGEAKVDGFTYKQMIEVGWTNEQLLTAENGKYASLVPSAMAPKPPAPAAPAPAPAQSFESAGV